MNSIMPANPLREVILMSSRPTSTMINKHLVALCYDINKGKLLLKLKINIDTMSTNIMR